MSKIKNGALDQYGKVSSLMGSAVKGLKFTKNVTYLVLIMPVDKVALRIYVHCHRNANICVLRIQNTLPRVCFNVEFIRSLIQ